MPVIVQAGEECWVDWTEDSQMFRRQLQYLVKWKGYNKQSCEPANNVGGIKAIEEYHEHYPGKLGSDVSLAFTQRRELLSWHVGIGLDVEGIRIR
jgi:hypothetical protein